MTTLSTMWILGVNSGPQTWEQETPTLSHWPQDYRDAQEKTQEATTQQLGSNGTLSDMEAPDDGRDDTRTKQSGASKRNQEVGGMRTA